MVDSFLFALALAVGLTPELLTAIVSLTLARGAQQMAASHVIVRRLNSIEDFDSMTVLCSDKTGTLTEGVIRLHAALDTVGDASDEVLLFAQLNAAFESGFPSANFGNMVSMAGASLFLPFLPLLPKQILLNNFLSDFPSMTIATDNVDREQVARPRRWDIRFVRNFMVVFGLVSTVVDYLTFGALLYWPRATEQEFQSGWFIESLMTELVIVLVIRTERPFFRSRPGTVLLASTLVVAGTTIFLPYTALGAMFGFVPLPPLFVLLLVAITGGYLVASELVKGWFFRRFAPVRPR